MTAICPTITVETAEEYAYQLARIEPFAERIHIDVADDVFTPRKLLSPSQVYFPDTLQADIHVMMQEPVIELLTLISLRPQLVVVHAEASGDIPALMEELQKVGIKAGLAVLPQTSVADIATLVKRADHVLIFAGHLGYQGGHADMGQTKKIDEIRAISPKIEIAWDGGVNDRNAPLLAKAGVDVLNVGGFIHTATDPAAAYRTLVKSVAAV